MRFLGGLAVLPCLGFLKVKEPYVGDFVTDRKAWTVGDGYWVYDGDGDFISYTVKFGFNDRQLTAEEIKYIYEKESE